MLRKTVTSGIAGGLCGGVILVGLLAGFVPQREGPELRRRASATVATLRPEDMPAPIVGISGGWSLRAAVTSPPSTMPTADAIVIPRRAHWISFADEGVSFATTQGLRPVDSENAEVAFQPLLPPDGGSDAPQLFAPQPQEYQETHTQRGRPVHWLPGQLTASCERKTLSPVTPGRIPALLPRQVFDAGNAFAQARRYQTLVENFSRRYGLSPALVYAIIQAESNFSPVLVSSQSAMGLMQLLPSTAGGEVHTFLHGSPGRVTFNELSDPEINIRYGTAYLHLLLNRHLADVENAVSREYCAVAAYNMGPNRFLRMFSEDRATALAKINAMTPEQIFETLTTTLPIFETRAFVAKVTRSRGEFAALNSVE